MKPAAGVTATMPATAPEARPTPDILPWKRKSSTRPQVSAAAAGAKKVLAKAYEASPPALSALPPLKPSQPNQSRPAPRMAKGTLWGSTVGWRRPRRLPRTMAKTTRRGGGVDVHHGAAREVERAQAAQPAAGRPDPVRHRRVDHDAPQEDEEDEGLHPHALDHGAGDEGGGDDGEHGLEEHEGRVGHGPGELLDHRAAHAGEADVGRGRPPPRRARRRRARRPGCR